MKQNNLKANMTMISFTFWKMVISLIQKDTTLIKRDLMSWEVYDENGDYINPPGLIEKNG